MWGSPIHTTASYRDRSVECRAVIMYGVRVGRDIFGKHLKDAETVVFEKKLVYYGACVDQRLNMMFAAY
jgi:hypothetical protein